MNEEIKFRAWGGVEGKKYFVYFGLNRIHDDYFEDERLDNGSRLIHSKDKELIIHRFTGLKDKNGKEIYEGDVVNLTCSSGHPVTATVEWIGEEVKFSAYIHDKKVKVKGGSHDGKMVSMREMHIWAGMHTCLCKHSCAWGHVEVIGNVQENPKLIK